MSEFSDNLLQTSHKGVHEQFDMLAAAMQVQVIASSDDFYSEIVTMTQRAREKWFKEQLAIAMKSLGNNPGFLQKRLLVYVYQLYEHFYENYTTIFKFKDNVPLNEIQYSILLLAAAFLDNQFTSKGLADICGFLKQDAGTLADQM